ncbi:hypothetical protein HOLleu_42170 [Holothuria leucospilota]|uniref:Ig-like domain-containing protein n=1 Tax=Holothuria leucospilota TaxID=206669 RepID=A0A9Q1BBG8_HOLLE|nr:hypothetical protein HOLleu_42170 [Holothuria leucospilota]
MIKCFYSTEPVKMTILTFNHFESEVDSKYQCYLNNDDSDEDVKTMESMRTGWTRDTAKENPDPPSPSWHSGSIPRYTVTMGNNGANDAFGVFGCKATKPGKLETSISTTRMRSDAVIVPTNELFTQTVNINDTDVRIDMNLSTDVRIDMNLSTGNNLWNLRWQHNNGNIVSVGGSTFLIEGPIQLHDAGIYECYVRGNRSLAEHGLNVLLVRGEQLVSQICCIFKFSKLSLQLTIENCHIILHMYLSCTILIYTHKKKT